MATDTFQLNNSDDYVAVSMNHFIMIIKDNNAVYYDDEYTIWVYNLYTEEWRKLGDLPGYAKHSFKDSCGVALGPDVYLFGVKTKTVFHYSNSLLKLNKQFDGHFVLNEITLRNCKLPSPRSGHTGWAFDNKLWIFGGHGTSESGYLDDFGYFINNGASFACNNQLLCFDPASWGKWRNPECFGTVPSPRSGHATTITSDKVILFGGHDAAFQNLGDLYELNMHSLTWTQIQNGHIKPQERIWSSLTTLSEGGHLVLHGGTCLYVRGFVDHKDTFTDIWVLDLESMSWTEYTQYKMHPLYGKGMGFTGPHSVVTIGCPRHGGTSGHTIHIMLQPKSLQQLSIQTINNHWEMMPKNCLPKKLLALFSGPYVRYDNQYLSKP